MDINNIPNADRYLFTVDYIFPSKYSTVAAFEKKDFETGFHVQEFYEINLISKGEGYHAIGDTIVEAKRGDVFIVPPGHKHAFIGGKGFNVYHMHLSPAFLEQYTPRMNALPSFFTLFEVEPLMRMNGGKYRHLYLGESALRQVLSLLDTVSEGWQGDAANMLIQESYIIIAITILCKEYSNLQTKVGKNANIDRLFMNSVAEIIENYHAPLTIDYLAQIAGMSRTSYIKRFSEAVGMSPRRFIMEHRIKMAKSLLRGTDKTLAKIAEETGFYDTSHLCKCFAAKEGISASDFRAKFK